MKNRATFLSDEWFDLLGQLMDQLGDPPVPAGVELVSLNFSITDSPLGQIDLSLRFGKLHHGHDRTAETVIFLPYNVAYAIIIENDETLFVEAFLDGKIRVKGNMAKIFMLGETILPANGLEHHRRIVAMTFPLS